MVSATQIRYATLAGQLARRLGQPESDCPFAHGTPLREAWASGWKRRHLFEPIRDAALEEVAQKFGAMTIESLGPSVVARIVRGMARSPATLLGVEHVRHALRDLRSEGLRMEVAALAEGEDIRPGRAVAWAAERAAEVLHVNLDSTTQEAALSPASIPNSSLVAVASDMPGTVGACDHHRNPDCRHTPDEILHERRAPAPRPCPTGPDGVPCEPMPDEPTRCVYGDHPMPTAARK